LSGYRTSKSISDTVAPTSTHVNLVLAPIAPEGGQSGRVRSRQSIKRKRLQIGFEAVKTFLADPSAHILNYSALENDLRKLTHLRHPPRKFSKGASVGVTICHSDWKDAHIDVLA